MLVVGGRQEVIGRKYVRDRLVMAIGIKRTPIEREEGGVVSR